MSGTAVVETEIEPLSGEERWSLYRQMLLIRRFEERCNALFLQGKIPSTLHLYIGQEAVAVGICAALRVDDYLTSTHRPHGHALAKGVSAGPIMAELFAKSNGCCKGKGGSMHVGGMEVGMPPAIAIVGGGAPVAAGMALSSKMRRSGQVTASFFGDGGANEGAVHEAMNMAAIWKLPVLFVCENNLYAMGTALELSESEIDIHLKAQSYRLPAEVVDGMDVVAVEAAARRATAAIRAGEGPQFLECRTYRFRAHSMFDAELYREKAEVEEWKKHGPILRFGAWLRENDILHDTEMQAIETEVAAEVDAAVAFAEAGTWEAVDDLTKDVYAEPAR